MESGCSEEQPAVNHSPLALFPGEPGRGRGVRSPLDHLRFLAHRLRLEALCRSFGSARRNRRAKNPLR